MQERIGKYQIKHELGRGSASVVYLAYENHWFGLGLADTHATSGRQALVEYITGYLVEQSLGINHVRGLQ